mgnify:CR=1 FL=1
MTDLNEKLKLVAKYMGLNPSSKFVPRYQTDYNEQIPVWQKVNKEFDTLIFDHDENFTANNWEKSVNIITRFSNAIGYNTPLESFEILVTAIQFINNLKQKKGK